MKLIHFVALLYTNITSILENYIKVGTILFVLFPCFCIYDPCANRLHF